MCTFKPARLGFGRLDRETGASEGEDEDSAHGVEAPDDSPAVGTAARLTIPAPG